MKEIHSDIRKSIKPLLLVVIDLPLVIDSYHYLYVRNNLFLNGELRLIKAKDGYHTHRKIHYGT